MKLKQIIILLIMCMLMALIAPGGAVDAATDPSRTYVYDFKVDEGTSTSVGVWDEITLTIELKRVDEDRSGEYAMYSMQDEIIYDSRLFSLVAGSQTIAPGYDFTVRMMEDGIRQRIIVSRVVASPSGVPTPDELMVAVFRLKTLTLMEDEPIASRNFKVNSRSGDNYEATSNDVTVTTSGFDPSTAQIGFVSFDDFNALPEGYQLLVLTVPLPLETDAYLFQGQTFYYSSLYSDSAEGKYVYLLAVENDVTEEDVLAGVEIGQGQNIQLTYSKDVNLDNRVDSTDAVLVYGLYKGLHRIDPNFSKVSMRMRLEADVNGDRTVDTTDASIIMSYIWDGRPNH